jgi:hypothetical protein
MFPFQPALVPAIVEWFDTTLKSAPEKAPATSPQLPPTPVEEFWTILNQPGGASRALEMLVQARKKDPGALAFPENQVNALGYEKLQARQTKDAIDIFRVNITAFPDSANVYAGRQAGGSRAGICAEGDRCPGTG